MYQLSSLIEKIKLINQKYDEIEKINGINFNIFSILNMERHEVKTHSSFIYELLSPKGLHGKNDVFLKLFFEIVLGLNDYDDMNVNHPIQEDTTGENRRIDFTIKTSKYQIGIEMKIDAGDQKHQLYDYYYELEKRSGNTQLIKLFYLTLDGKEPTNESIEKGSEKLEKDQYALVSFDNEIVDWIEQCIKESATNTTVREALVQYLNLVKKITNKSNSKGRVMEVSEVFSNGENLKVYLEAEESAVQAKINLQLRFWKNLKEKLINNDLSFEWELLEGVENIEDSVENYYKKNRNNTGYGLNLYIDNEEDIFIFISFDSSSVYYAAGSEKHNGKFINDIKKSCSWDGHHDFHSWKHLSKKINFQNLLETPDVFKLFNNEELDELTNGIVNEVKIIKNEISKILKIKGK